MLYEVITQAELINHSSLVALSKIADILPMRHIGFGKQKNCRVDKIRNVSHEFDHLVGLGQMQTVGTRSLP